MHHSLDHSIMRVLMMDRCIIETNHMMMVMMVMMAAYVIAQYL